MSWRKSWPKLNIYGANGNGECSKRKLLPDERSVWDDYIDLAQLSVIRGKICITKNMGYTLEQLSEILNTPTEILDRSEKHLQKLDMITVDNKRVIEINNWSKYQSEYDRQSQYRVTSKGYKQRLQKKVTKKTSVSVSDSVSISLKKKEDIKKEEESFIQSLKTNPAYKHINIDTELGKMDAWLLAHKGRQKTKRFIVRWLNKIEIPMEIQQSTRRQI